MLGPLAYFIAFETPSRLPSAHRARPSQGAGPDTAGPGNYVGERSEEFDRVSLGVVPASGKAFVSVIRCVVLGVLLAVAIITNHLLVADGKAPH